MRSRNLVLALLLIGCNGRAADSSTTDGSAPAPAVTDADEAPAVAEAPAPKTGPTIIDICKWRYEPKPVCALLDDGHVVCARVESDHFEPPLAGINEAVEIACGEQAVCVREASGVVTCLDNDGKLRKPELLARARSLAPNCAVLEQGSVACWDVDWEMVTMALPQLAAALGTRDDKKLDLLRVALSSPGSSDSGCALHSSGDLWCWGYTANRNEAKPSKIHTFEQPGKVRQLLADGPNICWREDAGLQCTDGKSPAKPRDACDEGNCTCMFHDRGTCAPPGASESDAEMTVEGVVLRTDSCAVDSSGRVWCQHWKGLPPTPMGLTLEGETTQLAAFEGEPPTPAPSPLADPATAKCPAGAKVVNRVCGPLRQPGAAVACKPGARTCPCNGTLTWFDEDACEPEGFELVSVAGEHPREPHDWHTVVVHVDGDQVRLGPELKLAVEDIDWSEAATVYEFVDDRDEGDMFSYVESKLEAVVICALVDAKPACSAPLVRSLDFTAGWAGDDEYEDGETETVRYVASLKIDGGSVKVKVASKRGKFDPRYLPEYAGLRFLTSGTYSFAKLLDQPFVPVPG